MKAIDLDEAIERFLQAGQNMSKDQVIYMLNRIPTTEIVKCKDCMYWKRYDTTLFKGPAFAPCLRSDGMNSFTAWYDYCSHGERSEDE